MKTKSLLIAALLLGSASAANAITVAGVTWTPLKTSPNTGFRFDFNQWYVSSADATSSATNAKPDLLNPLTVPSQIVAGSQLTGTGSVYQINNTALPDSGTSQLTFTFGVTVASVAGNYVTFNNNGFANLYLNTPNTTYDRTAIPESDATSQANSNNAADGNLWLSFALNNFTVGSLVSNSSINAAAELDIIGGAAAYAFNPTFFLTYAAQYNSSAFFDANTQFSSLGNGQLRADVPEPTTLSLFAIGLLAFALSMRKITA
jgi:hypothetical protein